MVTEAGKTGISAVVSETRFSVELDGLGLVQFARDDIKFVLS